jgi:hypothetical protein
MNELDPSSLKCLTDVCTPAELDLWSAKTAAEFNAAFSSILLEAVRRLERSSKSLGDLSEDGLSDILCGFMHDAKLLIVSREESSNGHVDLTFKAQICRPPREVLGEAKIFNYYEWHVQGLSQLVDRYSTGREDRGLLLEYVKFSGIKKHMEELRKELDAKKPCGQTADCSEHETVQQWSFCTSHIHSSGEVIEVWHFGCNLHHAISGKKRKANKKHGNT